MGAEKQKLVRMFCQFSSPKLRSERIIWWHWADIFSVVCD